MYRFEVLNCHGQDAVRWQSFVDRLPWDGRDVMLTPAYYRVQAVMGDQGHCAVLSWDAHGGGFCLYPFMMRAIAPGLVDIATPYGFGGRVWKLPSAESRQITDNEFNSRFTQWCNAAGVVSEYCSSLACGKTVVVQENCPPPRQTVAIDLRKPDDEILAAAAPSRKAAIERAAREGITAGTFTLAEFWAAYSLSIKRKRGAKRFQFPLPYFCAHQQLGDERYCVLSAGDQHLLMLFGGRVAYYHLACRDEGSRQGSGEVLMLEAIRRARASGAQWLHLGGGLTQDPQDPLWRYKASWSPDRATVWSARVIHDQDRYAALCREAGMPPEAASADYPGWFPAYRAREAES